MNPITEFIKNIVYKGLEKYGRYYSSYRGFVIKNEDPESLNRLQLKVPNVYGDNTYEYWTYPKNCFSGPGYGCQVIPEKGDMVWVEFEMGDVRRPIWSHGHFGKTAGNHDIQNKSLRNIKSYWFKTPGGHSIEFIDNPSEIRIVSKDGPVITLDDSGINIDGGGNNIYLNGGFSVLYSKVPGTVIKDVAEIGISTSVNVGI